MDFRIWDKVNQKMHYDVLLSSGKYKLAMIPNEETGTWDELDYNNIIPMRSTSNLHKSKTTIFEFDIVKEIDNYYLVLWKDYRLVLYDYYNSFNDNPLDGFADDSVELEVVGNMFNTPELMEKVEGYETLKIRFDL